ncbi:MAG: ABC transporter ATP-binding protein [Candidatus Eiseniibacteriota bacterium]
MSGERGRVDADTAAIVRMVVVEKTYPMPAGDVHALRGVSLSVPPGDHLSLMGPSGCGKSTLLNLIGAVDLPTRGSVTFEGSDTLRLDDRARTTLRLRSVGFVFQRFFLLPMLSSFENVLLPMLEARVPRPEREDRARKLLEYVGLGDRFDHRPSQLSGGEMQRVAIARALANRPKILLADEPTGELDEATGQVIARLFRRLNEEGLTIVVVTHNAELAAQARRTLHLRDGRIVEETLR